MVLATPVHTCQPVHQRHPGARCPRARYPTWFRKDRCQLWAPGLSAPRGQCLFKGPVPGWDRHGRLEGLSSGLVPAVECVGPFHFQDAVDGQLEGSMELVGPGQGRVSGGASVSGSSSASMNVCTLRVDPNTWTAMLQER